MMLTRAGSAVTGVVGMTALLMAMASIWLVLADPVAVANAVGERGCQALVEEAAELIVRAAGHVVRWL